MGKKHVERLMREAGLEARRKRPFRRATDANHTQPIAPSVLNRQFDVAAPNKAWVTDLAYIATAEGWLYLAAILDPYSRRVVGWATSGTNDCSFTLAATRTATAPTPARTTAPRWPATA